MSSWCLKGIRMFRGCAGGDWHALARVCAVLLAVLAPNTAISQMSEQEIAKAFEEDQDFNVYVSIGDERCADRTYDGFIKMAASVKDSVSRASVWGSLKMHAGALANCIAKQNEKHVRVNYADRSRMMGLLRGWHVLLQSELAKEPGWGEFADEIPHFHERAKLYLKYAADHNQPDAAEMLARLEKEFSPKTVSGDTKPDFVLSAEEAAGQLGSNEIAFDDRYKGKLLEVHGPVSHLSRPSGRISLFLLSASSKAKDELEDRRDIECQVTGGDEAKRITGLKKGMIIKVRGIYKPVKGNTNIPLVGCLIVSAKAPTPGVPDPLQ